MDDLESFTESEIDRLGLLRELSYGDVENTPPSKRRRLRLIPTLP